MKTNIDLDSIQIDGQKLKAAREAKGTSVADMANSLTLSRAQIQGIEEGGDKPFYSPAHKLLAVRKYAMALGVSYKDVVTGDGAVQTMQTMPTPENQPAASPAYQLGAAAGATDLRMASVARNAAIRRQLMIVAGGLCVLIALYAKVRGNSSEFVNPQEELAATQLMPEQAAQEPVPTAPLQNPQADPVEAAPVQVATAPDTAALPTPVPNAVLDGDPPCKPEPAGADLQSWTPSYKRKSDSRLFVISQEGGTVCITDASGKARLINLKPKVGHAFAGKPPYTVRSVQLDQFEMYLQGIRVKVPSETEAMKLIATELSAPEPDDQYLAAEQPDT